MKKSMMLIISIAAIALMTTNAFSWGHGKGRARMGGDCPRYMDSAWQDLTQDQQAQLKALRQQFIDDTYEQRASMASIRNEMRMMMETSQPDRDRLLDLSAQLADLRKELGEKRIDFQLAAKTIAPELRMAMGFGMGHGGYGRHGGKGGLGFGDCPRLPDTQTPE
ncbi:Spy/CpxP family protein refolding chaperone [Desulfospira joergensenii]|uniref:Spy/CpxP family protein refolding chaperone n=1 Tax=Desulfospira joergensenii TaxID=53329 RepID=UPI0003B675DC|nr:periplasmic heavy metal sensor [Desulfospira joergensenii]